MILYIILLFIIKKNYIVINAYILIIFVSLWFIVYFIVDLFIEN